MPQIQLPNGSFVQDSTEIIEKVEALFPQTPILPDLHSRPKQHLACRILELLGDEWFLVAAYHWRWAYSTDGEKGQWMYSGERYMAERKQTSYLRSSHRAYNEWQWGNFLRPNAPSGEQRATGSLLFDALMFRAGPKLGCVDLGISSDLLAHAFEQSTLHFLSLFEQHLSTTGWPFVLGWRPSLADYGLLGPLYAHLHEDPVPGFLMRTRCPLVAEWCDRVHNRGGQIDRQRRVVYDRENGRLVDCDRPPYDWPDDDEVSSLHLSH